MVSTFQLATYGLNLAKRKHAKEITESYEKQLTEARERQKKAEKEAGEGRQREISLLAALEAQKAEVKAYRDNLVSRLQTNASVDLEPSTSSNKDV